MIAFIVVVSRQHLPSVGTLWTDGSNDYIDHQVEVTIDHIQNDVHGKPAFIKALWEDNNQLHINKYSGDGVPEERTVLNPAKDHCLFIGQVQSRSFGRSQDVGTQELLFHLNRMGIPVEKAHIEMHTETRKIKFVWEHGVFTRQTIEEEGCPTVKAV